MSLFYSKNFSTKLHRLSMSTFELASCLCLFEKMVQLSVSNQTLLAATPFQVKINWLFEAVCRLMFLVLNKEYCMLKHFSQLSCYTKQKMYDLSNIKSKEIIWGSKSPPLWGRGVTFRKGWTDDENRSDNEEKLSIFEKKKTHAELF